MTNRQVKTATQKLQKDVKALSVLTHPEKRGVRPSLETTVRFAPKRVSTVLATSNRYQGSPVFVGGVNNEVGFDTALFERVHSQGKAFFCESGQHVSSIAYTCATRKRANSRNRSYASKSWAKSLELAHSLQHHVDLQKGKTDDLRQPLSRRHIGSRVCNLGGKFVRSGGAFATLRGFRTLPKGFSVPNPDIAHVLPKGNTGPSEVSALLGSLKHSTLKEHVILGGVNSEGTRQEAICKLPSGEIRYFPASRLARSGRRMESAARRGVAECEGQKRKLTLLLKKTGKGGRTRHLGIRPTVRGVARNPIDHPHGGGEGKSSGGRPSVTPWGKPARGQPTSRSTAKILSRKGKRTVK